MSKETIEQIVRKYVLQNAVLHKGTANEKSVMQKIMTTHAELRKEAKKISELVEQIVPKINEINPDAQKEELMNIDPTLLDKIVTEKRVRDVPPLKNAEMGNVVTRYAPEPNGDMHLGHAFTAFFAHYYAQKYKGEFVLRFEDTNPKQEEIQYMDAHKEALEWLGLQPDRVVIVSNDMDIFYEKAEFLIKNNHVYTCTCNVEKMRDLRNQELHCEHASKTIAETTKDWKKMLVGEYDEGSIVLRLRGDMKNKNAVMRDPAIFAIRKSEHCLQGTKYATWPLYDFAVAIEDKICGITHVGRSAEFDTRIEFQNKVRELLGLIPHPNIFHFARYNVIGSPASKRKIKPLVLEGKVEGWDDIRLVTIKGLKKRGILPETIKQIAKEAGMTTQPTNIDWTVISSTNRKLIDKQANRYFFVDDPVVVFVKNAPADKVCNLPYHPDFADRGTRKIQLGKLFLIAKSDYKALKKDQEFRLKDLYNVKLVKKKIDLLELDLEINAEQKELLSQISEHAIVEYTDKKLKPGLKIQWTLADPKAIIAVDVKVPGILFVDGKYNKNSMKTVSGYGEKAVAKLKVDDIVQFERFGFVRIDKIVKNKIFVNRAHK
ncbi:MAG: glutamate--tRNA ligase [Candidatus Heimdallarchaeota archaeon]